MGTRLRFKGPVTQSSVPPPQAPPVSACTSVESGRASPVVSPPASLRYALPLMSPSATNAVLSEWIRVERLRRSSASSSHLSRSAWSSAGVGGSATVGSVISPHLMGLLSTRLSGTGGGPV